MATLATDSRDDYSGRSARCQPAPNSTATMSGRRRSAELRATSPIHYVPSTAISAPIGRSRPTSRSSTSNRCPRSFPPKPAASRSPISSRTDRRQDADVHRDGPAQAYRPAPHRRARLHAERNGADDRQYPRAHRRAARRAAVGRAIRLGRYRFDRTDHADARDPVRFPLGGPPQADLLVRLGGRYRAGQDPSCARTSGSSICTNAAPISSNLWNSKVGKEPTPDLISMMIHSDAMARHGPDGIPRQSHPADRRRQRHHAQFDVRAMPMGSTSSPTSAPSWRPIPALIPNAVQEIIRWQTPLAHMRRTATAGYRARRPADQRGRQARAVVSLGQSRRERVRRRCRQHHRRSRQCAAASGVRLWHPSLRRRAAGRTADQRPARGNGQAADARERDRRAERVAACFVHGYRKLPVELSRY